MWPAPGCDQNEKELLAMITNLMPQSVRGCARFFASILAVAAISAAFASPSRAQDVPPQLQPPAGQELFLKLQGKGDQVYVCKADATPPAWTLKAPDAQLFKDGAVFGKHYAGPSWESSDSSKVVGKAAANVPSPDANSIPWLLVNVVTHEGKGVLDRANYIQRLNTKGGKAPASGCDAAHAGQEIRVPYSADYLFYAAK
jgi:opacity protein-like surface antigen